MTTTTVTEEERLRAALSDANSIIAMTREHLSRDHPDCAYAALGVMNDATRADSRLRGRYLRLLEEASAAWGRRPRNDYRVFTEYAADYLAALDRAELSTTEKPSSVDRALERLEWAEWIARQPFQRDHACAECVPGGPIVIEGFQCIPHAARAVVRPPDDESDR